MMSLTFLFFFSALSLTRGGHQKGHIGLDISKPGKISLAWASEQTQHEVEHFHLDSCVLVECQTGSLRAGRRNICDETKQHITSSSKTGHKINGDEYCAVITSAFQSPEQSSDDAGAIKIIDDDVVYYEVNIDRHDLTKKVYFEQVADVLFSRLRNAVDSKTKGSYGRKATLMVPAKYLFEERELVIAGLGVYGIRVVEVIRCHGSECDVKSDSISNDDGQELLDWTVLKRTMQENETTKSSSSNAYDSNEKCRGGFCQDKAEDTGPSSQPSFSYSNSVGRDKPHRTTDSEAMGPSIVPIKNPAIFFGPSGVPSWSPSAVPSSIPSAMPTSLPSTVPSFAPSSLPTIIPTHIPSIAPLRTPTRTPSTSPSSIPTKMPSRVPSSSHGRYRVVERVVYEEFGHSGDLRRVHSDQRGGVLTAGEWSDVKEFPFWTSLMNCKGSPPQCWSKFEKKWRLCTAYPITVTVTQMDDDLSPADLTVKIFSDSNLNMKGTGRTNVDGKVTVFLMIDDDEYGCDHRKWDEDANARVVVQVERQFMGEFDLKQISRDPQTKIPHLRFVIGPVQQNRGRQRQVMATHVQGLDLMFVTDTTGSMADELSFLQTDLEGIIRQVQRSCHGQLRIRTSVNFYRDVGDTYVVRNHPFDEDVRRNVLRLDKEFASGGGDFPEAVEMALDDAVFGHKWSAKGDVKARLMFLVLDAPPRSNKAVFASLRRTLKKAQAMGIRIIPVTGSGIDKNTEFLMRIFGIVTDGRYVHLTDDSGVGLPHLETKTTIPPHPIGRLRDVITRIVEEYLGC